MKQQNPRSHSAGRVTHTQQQQQLEFPHLCEGVGGISCSLSPGPSCVELSLSISRTLQAQSDFFSGDKSLSNATHLALHPLPAQRCCGMAACPAAIHSPAETTGHIHHLAAE